MNNISENLEKIREKINLFEKKYSRALGSTSLIAVSKTRSAEEVRRAYEMGLKDFGENYLQDFFSKKNDLSNLPIEWHFIGKIQSNKTRDIAQNFSWVHSIDREKIAVRLNEKRPSHLPKLNVCIEVNISRDPKKSGVFEEEVESLARTLESCSRLNFRGLMTILEEGGDFNSQRENFGKLKKIFDYLNKSAFSLDVLSMGMSGDFEAAIAAGATHIRIGQAIFGERKK